MDGSHTIAGSSADTAVTLVSAAQACRRRNKRNYLYRTTPTEPAYRELPNLAENTSLVPLQKLVHANELVISNPER
jgi:hypothetical protein